MKKCEIDMLFEKCDAMLEARGISLPLYRQPELEHDESDG